MTSLSLHRMLCFLLALTFALFNIGLPVVIDVCPMPMPAGAMMCALCHEDGGIGATVPVVKSPPCCAPVLAAERNMTEFLRGPDDGTGTLSLHVLVAVAVVVPVQSWLPSGSVVAICASPPLSAGNLPVLHSSLLI